MVLLMMSCIKIQHMLRLSKKEKSAVLKGEDHVHAYANFYFRMEEKNLQEEEQVQKELIDLGENNKQSQSSFISALTASSLESLPDSTIFSPVECWLESLEKLPDHDHEDTFENISEVYDTPYKETVNNAPRFTQTHFLNIFIKTELPPPKLRYENLPSKPSSLNQSIPLTPLPTKLNNTKITQSSCTKANCASDIHYACTDILKLYNLEQKRNITLSKFAKSDDIIRSYSTPSTSPRSNPSHSVSSNARHSITNLHSRFTSVDSGLASDISADKSIQNRTSSFNTSKSSSNLYDDIENSSHWQGICFYL